MSQSHPEPLPSHPSTVRSHSVTAETAPGLGPAGARRPNTPSGRATASGDKRHRSCPPEWGQAARLLSPARLLLQDAPDLPARATDTHPLPSPRGRPPVPLCTHLPPCVLRKSASRSHEPGGAEPPSPPPPLTAPSTCLGWEYVFKRMASNDLALVVGTRVHSHTHTHVR